MKHFPAGRSLGSLDDKVPAKFCPGREPSADPRSRSWSSTFPAREASPPGLAEPDRAPGPVPPIVPDRGSRDDAIAAAAAIFVGMRLDEIERIVIEATIGAYGNSLPKAARVLGVSPSTLYRKSARWNHSPKEP